MGQKGHPGAAVGIRERLGGTAKAPKIKPPSLLGEKKQSKQSWWGCKLRAPLWSKVQYEPLLRGGTEEKPKNRRRRGLDSTKKETKGLLEHLSTWATRKSLLSGTRNTISSNKPAKKEGKKKERRGGKKAKRPKGSPSPS